MKIRNGFVSNSSSSSFLIYGVYVNNIDEITLSLIEDGTITEEEAKDMCVYEIGDIFCDKLGDDSQLECRSIPYDNGIYIGISPDNIKDDNMTFGQFKQLAVDEIKFHLPGMFGNKDFSWYQEAWQD